MGNISDRNGFFRLGQWQGAAGEGPLVPLAYDHKAQRSLADLLEAVADSLPDEVNRGSAALAAGLLRERTAGRGVREELALFALMEPRALPDSPLRRAIALARRENIECDGRAIELAEELDALAETGRARNPDALGFMLRAFFDGLRRHLDWVEIAIVPHARDMMGLTGAAPCSTRAGLGARAPVARREAAPIAD